MFSPVDSIQRKGKSRVDNRSQDGTNQRGKTSGL